jgi:predicted dinucleotide-binding enzyme
MNVTIIGAGNMGRGIGHRLVVGGHDVTVVDRDPEEAGRLAEELRGAAQGGATVEAAGPGVELRGEVMILAVYYPGTLELARELGERLAGKVVVDIANPLNQTFDGLATAPGTSAAEEIAATMPAGARVVKAFNTTFPARPWRDRLQANRSMCSSPGTMRRPRRRWRNSCATGACVPSTSVRWSARGSWRGWGFSGSRCNSRWA